MERSCFVIYIHDRLNEMPLNINHYVCLKSQIEINQLDSLTIYSNEPESLYKFDWIVRLLNDYSSIIKVEYIDRVTTYKGNSILNPTQETDILRLTKLIEHGGLYIDMDVLAVKAIPDSFWNTSVTIQAPENTEIPHGLGSAVIIAPKDSEWCKSLLVKYDNYDKEIKKGLYELIIYEPFRESIGNKYIHVITPEKFYPIHYYYKDCEQFFFLNRLEKFLEKDPYMVHLWENRNKNVMKYLSIDYFLESSSTYAQLARTFLI